MLAQRFSRSLLLLSVLALGTACGPAPSPAAGPTAAPSVTPMSFSLASSTPVTPLPATPLPVLDVDIQRLAIGPQGEVYASGYGDGAQQLPQAQIARWEGGTWRALDTGFEPQMQALAVDHAGRLYAEFLTDAQQGLSNAILRWDGAGWQDLSANFGTVVDALKAGRLSSNIPVRALAVDAEDRLYAAGAYFYPSADNTAEFPMGYVARWDGATWSVLGAGFDQVNILAMAVTPGGELYVAGEQPRTPEGNSSFIARWDGETWVQLDTSGLSTSGSLTLDGSGGLYAGSITSEPDGSIEHWDGTGWTNIPARLGGEAPAILAMAVAADGDLYIAGTFEAVNGTPARYLARWDGRAWQDVGRGLDRQVNTLAIGPGGDLYAAGSFTHAGGLPVQRVARWDGQSWQAPASRSEWHSNQGVE